MKVSKIYQYFGLGFFILLFIISCKTAWYKVVTPPLNNLDSTSATVTGLISDNRYFILRNGNESYFMKNIEVSNDKKNIIATLEEVPTTHLHHLSKQSSSNTSYSQSEEDKQSEVINEAHLYIMYDSTAVKGKKYYMDVNKLNKIEILKYDKQKTTNRTVVTTIVVIVGVAVLALVVAIATKSSCPFISAFDGNDFLLQGEIYGGAIYPQLERHDYLKLKMKPTADGSLQLKISNELRERQFTDLADLWVVTHHKDSKVLADEQGVLYSVTSPQLPKSAILNNTIDVKRSLGIAGDDDFSLMNDTSLGTGSNEISLKFTKPADASKGKLILTLKNSYFLDLLYGKLAEGLGSYYNTYVSQQKKKSAQELRKWIQEQRIPLTVSLKTKHGWKVITELSTIGPLATRDIVIPVDVSSGGNELEVRLSSGFYFWEIDYAAIDFSENEEIKIEKCKPSIVTDEKGHDVLSSLQNEDGIYLSQPNIGDYAIVVYKPFIGNDQSKSTSYILHSKGYYEHVRDFNNKPNIAFLKQFRKPGAFPLYGMKLYKETISGTPNIAKLN